MNFIGIIPARHASSRFPGKPLAEIQGKTMIQRVYEQAKKSKMLSEVIVATDDERIEKVVKNFGGKVVMTSINHQSGTDRCFEAVEKIGKGQYDVVVNVQGDEPFAHPEQIDLVCSSFKSAGVTISTLVKKIASVEELVNVNTPKVIFNTKKEAIYFSRSPIPFYRGKEPAEWIKQHSYYKHIGIYAYTVNTLTEITNLKSSPLEIAESLEQLRWIEHGYKINVEITELESLAIDTSEDLLKI